MQILYTGLPEILGRLLIYKNCWELMQSVSLWACRVRDSRSWSCIVLHASRLLCTSCNITMILCDGVADQHNCEVCLFCTACMKRCHFKVHGFFLMISIWNVSYMCKIPICTSKHFYQTDILNWLWVQFVTC